MKNSCSKKYQSKGSNKPLAIVGIAGVVALAITFTSLMTLSNDTNAADMVVYKDPNCGCCGNWISHMKMADHKIIVKNRKDLVSIKNEHNIPGNMRSCHTAVVDGYFIEGHVPAEDIERLLTDKPDIKGLAVPGMPTGSPGMEMPGRKADKYNVYTVDSDGKSSVFAKH